MERLLEKEEGQEPERVVWPEPREDPEEEPSEPWARSGQHPKKPFPGWERES